jgi:hypothetical protein
MPTHVLYASIIIFDVNKLFFGVGKQSFYIENNGKPLADIRSIAYRDKYCCYAFNIWKLPVSIESGCPKNNVFRTASL